MDLELEILNSLNCGVILFKEDFSISYMNSSVKNLVEDSAHVLDDILSVPPENVFNLQEYLEKEDFKDLKTPMLLRTKEGKEKHTEVSITKWRDQYVFLLTESDDKKKNKELEKMLRDKIFETSFVEGYAESSVYIMHNIGNKLCSLATLVSDSTTISYLNQLDGVFKQMDKKIEDETVKDAIKVLIGENNKQRELLNQNINETREKVDFISKIINDNQKYAQLKKGLKTDVKLLDSLVQVETTLKNEMNVNDIKINYSVPEEICIEVERNGFVESIKNILTNSIEAIAVKKRGDGGEFSGEITVMGQRTNMSTLLIISDNGVGIDHSNISQVFNLGFSTKKSLGEGMHYCSNFFNSFGGTIQISSAGHGQGTTVMISMRKTTKGQKLEDISRGEVK